MTINLERFRSTFFEEAAEHLATIEHGLLRLEAAPADAAQLDAVFRAAHSIKGASGMFGLHELGQFTHGIENLLDRLRSGRLAVTSARLDLLLRATDVLRVLVEAARTSAPPPAEAAAVTAELLAAVNDDASPAAAGGPAPVAHATNAGTSPRRYHIHMRPAVELLQRGQDPLLLLRELADLGQLSDVTPDLSALPSLGALDPESCYIAWAMTLETTATVSDIRDVFMFVDDICDVTITDTTITDSTPAAEVPATGSAPAAPARAAADVRAATGTGEGGSIRVATEKVDEMINLVGELVISHSMVLQLVSALDARHVAVLEEAVEEMGRNMRDLQERVLKVRMLPVGTVFSRFPRLVRDIATATGKSVRLEMTGEDTELDKTVIEGIADPLTHLIRNAADHGIESPEARRAAGKPEIGTIRLSASHRGGNVVIEIADDGPGLSLERIRAKAVALGLLRPDEHASDEQLQQMIFQPGFSTAPAITDVSGRGVGMDVVRRNVESLNGGITIDSQPGRGTRFSVTLPLTLAILDGMAVGVGDQVYVLPLLCIIESFRATPDQLTAMLGEAEVVRARGESVPLVRLHRVLGVPGAVEDPSRALIVLVEHDGRRFGLMVDDLLGQSQVVIRNLESNFRRVDGVMGATIMGDGRVALILDVHGLTRLASRHVTSPPPTAPELVSAAA